MPNTQWLGRAGAVADKFTITVAGSWAATETITISINGKDLVITVGSLISTSQVATTIQEAWEGSTLTDSSGAVAPDGGGPDYLEHSQLTASVSSAVVTLVGDVDGIPWLVADHLSPELSNDTAQGGTASTIQLAASETYSDNELIGHIIEILGGTGAGQWRFIDGYTGATDTADVTPDWDTNPDATSEYSIRKCGVQVSTDSSSGTLTVAPVTRATGPNHVDNVDNWSGGEVPGASASTAAYIGNSAVSLLYGYLDFTNTLTSWNIDSDFTGEIGLPRTNEIGYPEFRPHYLRLESSAIVRRGGDGVGSGRIKIDSVDVTTAVTIEDTGSGLESGLGAFVWKGTDGSNTLEMQDGSLSIAPFDGETATFTTIQAGSGSISCGPGVTHTTVTIGDGQFTTPNNITTVTAGPGSTLTMLESATIATGNIRGGTLVHRSSGTITTLNLGGQEGATLDCSQDSRSKTITTLNVLPSATILDPHRTLTLTNAIVPNSTVQSVVVE